MYETWLETVARTRIAAMEEAEDKEDTLFVQLTKDECNLVAYALAIVVTTDQELAGQCAKLAHKIIGCLEEQKDVS